MILSLESEHKLEIFAKMDEVDFKLEKLKHTYHGRQSILITCFRLTHFIFLFQKCSILYSSYIAKYADIFTFNAERPILNISNKQNSNGFIEIIF